MLRTQKFVIKVIVDVILQFPPKPVNKPKNPTNQASSPSRWS